MFIKVEKIENYYEVLKKLGNGLHSNVFEARELSTNNIHAIKISKKAISKKKRENTQILFAHEATILKQLNHVNIIRFHSAYEYPYHFAITMERLYGGELFDHIASLDEIVENDSKNYAKQIVMALEYLHHKSIAHLDIKPENIVLVDKNKDSLKIIDFSLSCIINKNEPVKQLGGTIEFMAPEALNYENIGTETDMWSFGVLLYLLLTGCSPYLGDTDEITQTNILQNNVDYNTYELKRISKEGVDLVKNLLIHKTEQRYTASKCLSHPWFKTKTTTKQLKSVHSINTKGFEQFQTRKKWFIGSRMVIRSFSDGGMNMSTI